ncbi:MAG: hypothetical protein GYA55_03245 [SAR324 cluster bacterium]|uniref:CopG family transcriptional regulator n=1 Tax=SAR324 cluster bacterium TaxID=2024889 RepID=A0A7X9FPZ3_9DELT|nr:hypothetical protein [SAR324 cluster bacterium]
MKTTIQLSDHMHTFLSSLCKREEKTLGEEVEEIVIHYYQTQRKTNNDSDIPLLPARAEAKPVTPEMVDEILSGVY